MICILPGILFKLQYVDRDILLYEFWEDVEGRCNEFLLYISIFRAVGCFLNRLLVVEVEMSLLLP